MNTLQDGSQVSRITTTIYKHKIYFETNFENFTGSFNICLKSLQDIHLFVASYRSVSPSVYVFHEDQYLVHVLFFFFLPQFSSYSLAHNYAIFVIVVPQLLSIIFLIKYMLSFAGQGDREYMYLILTKFNSVMVRKFMSSKSIIVIINDYIGNTI